MKAKDKKALLDKLHRAVGELEHAESHHPEFENCNCGYIVRNEIEHAIDIVDNENDIEVHKGYGMSIQEEEVLDAITYVGKFFDKSRGRKPTRQEWLDLAEWLKARRNMTEIAGE